MTVERFIHYTSRNIIEFLHYCDLFIEHSALPSGGCSTAANINLSPPLPILYYCHFASSVYYCHLEGLIIVVYD